MLGSKPGVCDGRVQTPALPNAPLCPQQKPETTKHLRAHGFQVLSPFGFSLVKTSLETHPYPHLLQSHLVHMCSEPLGLKPYVPHGMVLPHHYPPFCLAGARNVPKQSA